MITLRMTLIPFGRKEMFGEELILVGTIYSEGDKHYYHFQKDNGTSLLEGWVPKAMSGHKNPLHLLSQVMAHAAATETWNELGKDYVMTSFDIPKEKS